MSASNPVAQNRDFEFPEELLEPLDRWAAGLKPGPSYPLNVVPVACGSHVNAFGIVRSLAPKGWRTLLLDHEPRLAVASRFSDFLRCPNPDEDETAFVGFCLKVAETIADRGLTPLFFPTNDEWLRPLARWHSRFDGIAILPFPDWERLRSMLDKAVFARKIAELGIPTPSTAVMRGAEFEGEPPAGFTYPIIVKPADWTPEFLEYFHEKATVVRDGADWSRLARSLRNEFAATAFVVQDYIPGRADTLYTVTTYSTKEGEVRGISMGHKVLQKPPGAGTIVTGATCYLDTLEDYIRRLSRGFGMYGIANTEFKYDPRDGQYKVLEINMRPGMWHYSACAAGVNLPLMCIQDTTGNLGNEPAIVRGKRRIYWTVGVEEMLWRLRYRKHLPPTYEKVRRLPHVDAVWNAKDPGPFLFMLKDYFAGIFWRRERVWI